MTEDTPPTKTEIDWQASTQSLLRTFFGIIGKHKAATGAPDEYYLGVLDMVRAGVSMNLGVEMAVATAEPDPHLLKDASASARALPENVIAYG